MAYPFLSLDGSGFINEPSLKVDAILACYSSTQYSQTVLYRDSISSISKDIQMSSQQWDKLPNYMQGSLERLFGAYFDNVDIKVNLDEDSMNAQTASFKLTIVGTLMQDNIAYDLAKLLTIDNAKFSKVTDFSLGNVVYA